MKKILAILLTLICLQTHANKFQQFKKIANYVSNMWNKKDVFKITNEQLLHKASKTSGNVLHKGSKSADGAATMRVATSQHQTTMHPIPLGFPLIPSPWSILASQKQHAQKQYHRTKDWYHESPHFKSWRQQSRNTKLAAAGLLGAGGLCLYAQSKSRVICDEEDINVPEFKLSRSQLKKHNQLKKRLDKYPEHQKPYHAAEAMKYLASFLDGGYWQKALLYLINESPQGANVLIAFFVPHAIFLAQHCAESVAVVQFLYDNKPDIIKPIIDAIYKNKKDFAKTTHGQKVLKIIQKPSAHTPSAKELIIKDASLYDLPNDSLLKKAWKDERTFFLFRWLTETPKEKACEEINAILDEIKEDLEFDMRAKWVLKFNALLFNSGYLNKNRMNKIKDAIKRALPEASKKELSQEFDYCKDLIKKMIGIV